MSNREFITKIVEILNRHGCNARLTNDESTLCFGSYSYMSRSNLITTAKEILKLEGYSIVEEVRKSVTGKS